MAQLTPAGTQINEAHIAVDSNGVTDVAAIASFPGAAAVITARRPAGGVFAAPTVLGTGSRIERLAAVAAGRSGLVTWLRSETGPPPELRLSTRIHAAARRGDGALRPAAVRVARGGTATASEPRPALAPDGSAVIVSNFGGAVHVARRAPRRRVFSRPRVISTITGGTQPFTYTGQGPTVAAATGGRALVAWTNADGLLRVTPFVPRARDRSGRQEARPPRFRSTPPVLDITTKPATIRASVFCDRPCRVSILIRVSGSGGSTRVRARGTLRHRGRVKIVEQISGSQDREIRDGTIRAVTTRVIVANRYGATVTRERRPL